MHTRYCSYAATMTAGVGSSLVAATTTSLCYLWHPSSVAKWVEIHRIWLSQTIGTGVVGTQTCVQFITAEKGTPGGTAETIQALDRNDAVSGLTFRTGATGAPTRTGGVLSSFLLNATDFTRSMVLLWDSTEMGKPITLRPSVAEGIEVQNITGVSAPLTAPQIIVGMLWTEQ